MSRVENSADSWDGEGMPYGLWQGAYDRAITSTKGLRRLEEMKVALEALPERRLCEATIADGKTTCFVGAIVAKRIAEETRQPIDVVIREMHERAVREYGDPAQGESWEDLSTTAETASAYLPWTVASEWASLNDGEWSKLSDEERWQVAMDWVTEKIESHPRRVS